MKRRLAATLLRARLARYPAAAQIGSRRSGTRGALDLAAALNLISKIALEANTHALFRVFMA